MLLLEAIDQYGEAAAQGQHCPRSTWLSISSVGQGNRVGCAKAAAAAAAAAWWQSPGPDALPVERMSAKAWANTLSV